MNIEADKLATKALKEGSSQPIVPFDPACGAMLSIHGCAVTRNIEATVHRSKHLAPIKEYYCKRFDWCPDTLKSIDWDVFSMVYTKFPRTRTFFSKFGWKQLPIGNRLHKWSPSYDHRCPSCDQDYETDDHIFQCDHILRRQWVIDLFREMQDKFGSFIDPELLTIIQIGLSSFFSDTAPDFSPRFSATSSTSRYLALIAQQTSIGWDHFLRGKLGTEWGIRQYKHAKRFDLLEASKQWQNSLVRFFAHSSHQLWQIRNGCRHGLDAAEQAQLKTDQTHREVRCLYHLRGVVLIQDRLLFRDNVEVHLTDTTAQLRTWLTHNSKLIAHSAKVATAQAALRIKQLRTFFPLQGTRRSTITTSDSNSSAVPRRHRSTRLASYFQSRTSSRSSTRSTSMTRKRQFSTPNMSTYVQVEGHSYSRLPIILEDIESKSTSPERRQLRRRGKAITGLFPDHPG
jgi:zinc-binding in reverse transcriptase